MKHLGILVLFLAPVTAVVCPDGPQPVHLQFLQVVDVSAFLDEGVRKAYRDSVPTILEELRATFGPKTETALNFFNDKPYQNFPNLFCSKLDVDMGIHSIEQEMAAMSAYGNIRYPHYQVGSSPFRGCFSDLMFKMLASPELAWNYNNFDADGDRIVRVISLATDSTTWIANEDGGVHSNKPEYAYFNAARENCADVDYPSPALLQRALNDFQKVSFVFVSTRDVVPSAPEWWVQTFLSEYLGGIAPGISEEIGRNTAEIIHQIVQSVLNLSCEDVAESTTQTPTSSTSVNPPGLTTDVINPPGSTTDVVNPPGSTTDAVNPPGSTTDVVNSPGSTTRALEPTTSTDAVNPPESTTDAVNPPGSTTDAVNPPGSTTSALEPSTSSDIVNPPGTTSALEPTTVTESTTDAVNPPGNTTDAVIRPGSSTDAVNPPGSTTSPLEPSTSPDVVNPPGSSTDVVNPPGSTTSALDPTTSTDAVSTDAVTPPGSTTDAVNPPGSTTDVVNPPGSTTSALEPTTSGLNPPECVENFLEFLKFLNSL